MANKVILGGRDVVKHYESHRDVKDKMMGKKKKLREQKKGYRAWLRISHQSIFSPHRVRRRERRGAPLGKEPNAPCYAPCFPKK